MRTKTIILALLLLVACLESLSAATVITNVNLLVRTNGLVIAPNNFWSANLNDMVRALSNSFALKGEAGGGVATNVGTIAFSNATDYVRSAPLLESFQPDQDITYRIVTWDTNTSKLQLWPDFYYVNGYWKAPFVDMLINASGSTNAIQVIKTNTVKFSVSDDGDVAAKKFTASGIDLTAQIAGKVGTNDNIPSTQIIGPITNEIATPRIRLTGTNGFKWSNSDSNVMFGIAEDGVVSGNGSGLTNLPKAAVVGLPEALTHLTNAIVGAGTNSTPSGTVSNITITATFTNTVDLATFEIPTNSTVVLVIDLTSDGTTNHYAETVSWVIRRGTGLPEVVSTNSSLTVLTGTGDVTSEQLASATNIIASALTSGLATKADSSALSSYVTTTQHNADTNTVFQISTNAASTRTTAATNGLAEAFEARVVGATNGVLTAANAYTDGKLTGWTTNASNLGVITLGQCGFTNITGDITVGPLAGIDATKWQNAALVVTNSTANNYKVTLAGITLATNSFCIGQDVWVTNKSKVQIAFSFGFGETNAAAVRYPQK